MNNNQHNKIVNINLKGGLIGLFADSPQRTLNKAVIKQNNAGYKVVQIISANSGNLLLFILRGLLLFVTFFFYTTANGYYLILEQKEDFKGDNNQTENKKTNNTAPKIPETNTDDLFN